MKQSTDPQRKQSIPTTVRCPNCSRPVQWSERSPFRPFCSKRCRLVDLGEWFKEEHYIPGEDKSSLENRSE